MIWINGTTAQNDATRKLFRQDSTKTGRDARGATIEQAAAFLAHDGLGSIRHYVAAEILTADESILGLMEETLPSLPELDATE